MSYVHLSEGGLLGGLPLRVVVPVLRSRQSSIRIWLYSSFFTLTFTFTSKQPSLCPRAHIYTYISSAQPTQPLSTAHVDHKRVKGRSHSVEEHTSTDT